MLVFRYVSAVGENVGVHEGPRSHAMGVDATPFVEPLLTSRALSFLSYHPEIPYSKGASLWHMLEAFWDSAGQDAFRVGPVLHPLHLFGALLGSLNDLCRETFWLHWMPCVSSFNSFGVSSRS